MALVMDPQNLISALSGSAGFREGFVAPAAGIPKATTKEGWTKGEAQARNQSRAIQARRQANALLSKILQTQMQGEDQKEMQKRANKNRLNIAKLRQQGATGRTGMTTQAQLERQRLADKAASGRLSQELGWKGQEAGRRREWLGNQELMKANRGLVSDILQRGGTVTPELGNVYNAPEGFTPSWEGMAGQQLVPTAPQRPLGYAEGQRLMTDEQGKPLYKGNRPVYERYLYNKETGQPYNPQPIQQPQQVTPSQAMQQAMDWLGNNQVPDNQNREYDLNKYYR